MVIKILPEYLKKVAFFKKKQLAKNNAGKIINGMKYKKPVLSEEVTVK